MVLPVPLSPANRTEMPKPAGALGGEAPALVHLEPLAHLGGDLAQGGLLVLGQDQIVPAGGGLDALGEPIHPQALESPARLPKRRLGVRWKTRLAPESGAHPLDILGAEAKLGGHALQGGTEPGGAAVQGLLPEPELVLASRLVDPQPQVRAGRARVAGATRPGSGP